MFPFDSHLSLLRFQSICERVTPRLSHANSAVVLSAVKVLMKFLELLPKDSDYYNTLLKKLSPPLVTLLSGEPEVQYVALRNINLIVQKRCVITNSRGSVLFFPAVKFILLLLMMFSLYLIFLLLRLTVNSKTIWLYRGNFDQEKPFTYSCQYHNYVCALLNKITLKFLCDFSHSLMCNVLSCVQAWDPQAGD